MCEAHDIMMKNHLLARVLILRNALKKEVLIMNNKPKNYILDFTHVYCDENMKNNSQFHWIDCSDIEGCDLYCSDEAAAKIQKRIMPYGTKGIHFIDSGNFHYITKITTDQIKQPFSLVVFDHHTDMQQPLVNEMMSCGDWAGLVLDQNPNLKQLILIGPDATDISQIDAIRKDRLLTFSAEELKNGTAQRKSTDILSGVPFYISIDKDVLSTRFTETNWNQRDMTLDMLEHLLGIILSRETICGIDICGECQPDLPLPEYMKAEEKNERINHELADFIRSHISTYIPSASHSR